MPAFALREKAGTLAVVRIGQAERAGAHESEPRDAVRWGTKPGRVVFSGINCREASFEAMPAFALRKEAGTLARGKDWTSGAWKSPRERATRCDPLEYQGGLGCFLQHQLLRGLFRGSASVCAPRSAGTLAHGKDWTSAACGSAREHTTPCGPLGYRAGLDRFLRHQFSRRLFRGDASVCPPQEGRDAGPW